MHVLRNASPAVTLATFLSVGSNYFFGGAAPQGKHENEGK